MKRRGTLLVGVVTLLCFSLSSTAFALEESEVETAIAASSEETVAGNVLIWFLCALAFLKVSQKIDSFMAGLGINVGRTGGSMLGELMIAGRALGAAVKATGGAFGNIFSRGGSSKTVNNQQPAAGEGFNAGKGVAGIAMRAAAPAAVASVTGKGKGGVRDTIVGAVTDSSINSGGKFGMGIVGAVAKGNLARDGSITGPKAAQALTSYLGYHAPGADAASANVSGSSGTMHIDSGSDIANEPTPAGEDEITLDGGAAANVHVLNPTVADTGMEEPVQYTSPAHNVSSNGIAEPSGETLQRGAVSMPGTSERVEASGSATAQINAGIHPIDAQPPTFRDVEIGGGRITGFETPAGGGEEKQFAMYSTSQYMQPTGPYETVTTVDGESWYKQYAQPVVQKTPYKSETGKIQYHEQIVSEMPQVPRRKDRV